MTAPSSTAVRLPRALAARTLSALRSAMTRSGHLAQRVTHEHLGYCAWNAESERCAAQRALIAELEQALEETCDTSISATV